MGKFRWMVDNIRNRSSRSIVQFVILVILFNIT